MRYVSRKLFIYTLYELREQHSRIFCTTYEYVIILNGTLAGRLIMIAIIVLIGAGLVALFGRQCCGEVMQFV